MTNIHHGKAIRKTENLQALPELITQYEAKKKKLELFINSMAFKQQARHIQENWVAEHNRVSAQLKRYYICQERDNENK